MKLGAGLIIAIVGLVLAACGAANPEDQAKEPTSAVAAQVDEPPARVLTAWKEAVNVCRGSLDDGPETLRACRREDQALDEMLAAGWCFGKQGQAKAEEDWHRCGPDSYRGSAREVERSKSPESVRVGGLTSPAVLNFETGLTVPLGMSVAEFQRQAPGAECVAGREETYCDMAYPLTCPSEGSCSEVAYSFRADRMDGFSAKYDAAVWRRMLEATEARYGKPRIHVVDTPELPIKSKSFIWSFDHGDLRFTEWSGTDVHGQPVRSPYSISFGSAASTPL